MTQSSEAFVFDTGPLRHFAVQGWLGVLKFLTAERGAIIPESVEYELKRQVHELPALHQVLDADWIRVDRSDDLDFLMAFARYEERLAVGEQNRGECGVLALGKTRGFETVLDDGAPRAIAEAEGIPVTATLPLLCQAIREGRLTVPMVESLADDLPAGSYYLPFSEGGFRSRAHQEALIEYE
ncbi:nucleotide-binding protein [Nocardioides sp. B-3]|uniref:nucleotide-binding protein n=1 Tax=Nocardioides sp. B-3 TaxID=2895565 RepID=UPI00215260A4|nr:nucleotide-binding protein [Nocardioides sp. B-3]UUZ57651.1 nucleotide-binding protein [Nocardioides sp. B-3]